MSLPPEDPLAMITILQKEPIHLPDIQEEAKLSDSILPRGTYSTPTLITSRIAHLQFDLMPTQGGSVRRVDESCFIDTTEGVDTE